MCDFFTRVGLWPRTARLDPRRWLRNFPQAEQPWALALLESFLYYSDEVMDGMFLGAIKGLAADVTTLDADYARRREEWQEFRRSVLITMPTGGAQRPTDSGHLFVRRARDLAQFSEDQLYRPDEVLSRLTTGESRPVLFVDDFVGTGDQFLGTWHRRYQLATGETSFAQMATHGGIFIYTPLICSADGALTLSNKAPGLLLRPAHLLSPQYSARAPDSLIWPESLAAGAEAFLLSASARAGIPPEETWGHGELALAIAFAHRTPDATLPILTKETHNWTPLIHQ